MRLQLNKCFFLNFTIIWTLVNVIANISGDSRISENGEISLFPSFKKLLSGFEFMKILPPHRPLFLIERDPSASEPLLVLSGLNKTFRLIRHRNPADIHRSESSFADSGEVLLLSSDSSVIKRIPATKLQGGINFVGQVQDDLSSHVHGHLTQHRFEGVIRANNQIYFVDSDSKGPPFVYQISGLGMTLSRQTNHSKIEIDYRDELIQQDYIARGRKNVMIHRSRQIRQSWMYQSDSNVWPKDCSVHVVVDYPFYLHVGGLDINRTISEVEMHFREVNLFLEKNDFDFDGRLNDLRLTISKLQIITQPSTAKVNLKTKLNPVEYLSSIVKSSFDDCCFVMLFSFMRFIGDESNQLFINMPKCRLSLLLFQNAHHRELCGKDVWIVSFNGHGDFKIPRAMSVIRMVSHVGYLLGISKPGPEAIHKSINFSYFENDWLTSIKYSDCAKKMIAQSLAIEELCSPRFNIRSVRREQRMAINSDNDKGEVVKSSEWFRVKHADPMTTEATTEARDNRILRQSIREWWEVPNRGTDLGHCIDDYVEQPSTSESSFNVSSIGCLIITVLLWLWLPVIFTFE